MVGGDSGGLRASPADPRGDGQDHRPRRARRVPARSSRSATRSRSRWSSRRCPRPSCWAPRRASIPPGSPTSSRAAWRPRRSWRCVATTCSRGTFDPGFRIRLHQKDLKNALELASEIDVALPAAAAGRAADARDVGGRPRRLRPLGADHHARGSGRLLASRTPRAGRGPLHDRRGRGQPAPAHGPGDAHRLVERLVRRRRARVRRRARRDGRDLQPHHRPRRHEEGPRPLVAAGARDRREAPRRGPRWRSPGRSSTRWPPGVPPSCCRCSRRTPDATAARPSRRTRRSTGTRRG